MKTLLVESIKKKQLWVQQTIPKNVPIQGLEMSKCMDHWVQSSFQAGGINFVVHLWIALEGEQDSLNSLFHFTKLQTGFFLPVGSGPFFS